MECNAESIIRAEPELTVLNHISWPNKYCMRQFVNREGDWKEGVELWEVSSRVHFTIAFLISACRKKASGCPSLLVASRFNIHTKNKSYFSVVHPLNLLQQVKFPAVDYCLWLHFPPPPEYLACLNSPLCYDQRNIYPEWHRDLMRAYRFADIAWEPPVLN